MRNDEFYIGWMPQAPAGFAGFLKKYLLLLFLLVIIVGVLVATRQKKFSTANFEFGKTTIIEGVYSSLPIPHLSVKDNQTWVFVPLVGYGKHGADGIIRDLEKKSGTSLEKKSVSFRGTLLYGDGKVLMQIDSNEEPLVAISGVDTSFQTVTKTLGLVSLKGEVIDPKCYFGVMKPGEGKVHKDCAIRCIAGGIPPVLAVTNAKGEKNYVLLVGEDGERLNDKVKDFVAVPSTITGELVQQENWLVMRVKKMKNAIATYTSEVPSPVAESGKASCCKKDMD